MAIPGALYGVLMYAGGLVALTLRRYVHPAGSRSRSSHRQGDLHAQWRPSLMKTLVRWRRSLFTNPAPARCTSWRRSTANRRYAPCSPCSEGVATGAADSYARMAGKPPLLHLERGLGNGPANLQTHERAWQYRWSISVATTPPTTPVRRPVAVDIGPWPGVSPGFVRTSCSRRPDGRDDADAVQPPAAAWPGGHAHPAGRRVLGRRRA